MFDFPVYPRPAPVLRDSPILRLKRQLRKPLRVRSSPVLLRTLSLTVDIFRYICDASSKYSGLERTLFCLAISQS
jgi:hypothetical protein